MKLRTIKGVIWLDSKNGLRAANALVTVRVTADKIRKSLSLTVEDMGLMIEIPIEPVEDMVEVKDEPLGYSGTTSSPY